VRRFMDIVEARRPRGLGAEGPREAPPVMTRDEPQGFGNFDFLRGLQGGGAVAPVGAGTDVTLPGRRARRTRQRTAATTVAPEVGATAAGHLSNLATAGVEDEIGDAEAHRRSGIGDLGDVDDIGHEPIEPTTANLPAVIRHEVALAGDVRLDPEWHQVKQLPGYFQNAIRGLGRSVFRQFTDAPLEDMQVLTTLGNINPEHDVVGMMTWIRRNGARDDSANIDFDRIMPGYQADVSLWRTADYSFLLVRDFAGHYIYGWGGGRGVHLAGPRERLRLR